MKLFDKSPDGGRKSGVTGYFVVEIKSLFSIVVLRFSPGSRDAYHSHAFHAITWFLSGSVREFRITPKGNVVSKRFTPSLIPKITTRDNMHKVWSDGVSWALSIRGPWTKTWKEYHPSADEVITLGHGRVEVQE